VAAPNYSVRSFDLATARDNTPIIEQGTLINAITVQSVPAGASASLHFGANRDSVPILTGDSWDVSAEGPNGCPTALDEGLFMTNPVGAGLVTLVISFGRIDTGVRTGF
jgi:hypothetical protein